jgi:hypothetical protein
MKALDEIAKRYGGENWNTGGNVHVAVIPLGPHDCMGVTGEVVCRYTNSKATCVEDGERTNARTFRSGAEGHPLYRVKTY